MATSKVFKDFVVMKEEIVLEKVKILIVFIVVGCWIALVVVVAW